MAKQRNSKVKKSHFTYCSNEILDLVEKKQLLAFLKENNVQPEQWKNFETWEDANFDDWKIFNSEDMNLEFDMTIETDASFDYDGPCGPQTHHEEGCEICNCKITLVGFNDVKLIDGRISFLNKLKKQLDITDFFSNDEFEKFQDDVAERILIDNPPDEGPCDRED